MTTLLRYGWPTCNDVMSVRVYASFILSGSVSLDYIQVYRLYCTTIAALPVANLCGPQLATVALCGPTPLHTPSLSSMVLSSLVVEDVEAASLGGGYRTEDLDAIMQRF